jgi:hypothetical protein
MVRLRALMLLALFILVAPLAVFAQEDLTDTYTDDTITLMLPDGWLVQEFDDNMVIIANEEDALTASPEDMEEGWVQVTIFKSFAAIEGIDMDSFEGLTAKEILTFFVDAGNAEFEYGRVRTFRVDGRTSAYMTTLNDTLNLEGLFILVDLGEGEMALISSSSLPGEADAFNDTVLDMAETLALVESTSDEPSEDVDVEDLLTENFSLRDDSFSFSLPEDWLADEDDGLIFMVNDEDVYQRESLDALEEGDLIVLIYPTIGDIPNYPADAAGGSSASTIVSYFASMGFATGYQQEGAMQEFEVNDEEAWLSFAIAETHERLVMSVSTGEDVATLVAFAPLDELRDHQPLLQAIMGTFVAES